MSGGPFDPYVHPAQTQPGQSDTEGDQSQYPEGDRPLRAQQCMRPEQYEGAPAAEAVDLLEVVVEAGAEGRQGGDDDDDEQGDEDPTQRDERQVGAVDGHHDRPREEPHRSGQCPSHVQSAEVVHLPERPPRLQRPARRSPSRQPEEEIDDVLLPYNHCEREVHEGRVADGLGVRRPTHRQQADVGQHHQGRQAVVVHQVGVLEEATGRGRERREFGESRGRGGRHCVRGASHLDG